MTWLATSLLPPHRPPLPAAAPDCSVPKIVALGGGTGLSNLLCGLRQCCYPDAQVRAPVPDRERITAIVTVADDGASSGALRRLFRIPPPGDIRNCLVALSGSDPALRELFNFRFDDRLGRHNLGNLILAALSQLENDFPMAVECAAEILGVRGRVLPATTEDVTLLAEFTDGSRIQGESRIASVRRPIKRVFLAPANGAAHPDAGQAIAGADLIVIGPGSLYTSLIPTLLVKEIADAIARARAPVVLVMNLMTEPGETAGYTETDFFLALRRHAPQITIDAVLVNSAPIPDELAARYVEQGAAPIDVRPQACAAHGCRGIFRDLLGTGTLIRHEPRKLARALLDLAAATASPERYPARGPHR